MQKKKVSMWKLLAVSTLALAGGVAVAGQGAKQFSPRAHVAAVFERAQKELNLSDGQKSKIKAILGEAIPRGIEIHDDKNLAPQEKRARLQQLLAETKTQIEAVLNPAQRAKLQQWAASRKARIQETMERIAGELKLTPEQRTRIKPVVEAGFRQALALRDDMNLTLAQKLARLHQIRRETRAGIDPILSSSQRARLDQITQQMRAEMRRQFVLWRDKNPSL